MKKIILTFLAFSLLVNVVFAQSGSDITISLKGDSNTEQAAKLELIRILQERLNKLTVSQLNARIIVSKGVADYYKVDEILNMNKEIWGYRSKYVGMAQKIEAGNSGFSAHQGNGFAYKYMVQLNSAVEKAAIIKKQLLTVTTSGNPVIMPAMPTFSISPASSDPGADLSTAMNQILSSYGISSQEDFDKLSPEKQEEIKEKMKEATKPFMEAMQQQLKDSNKKVLATLGNIAGAFFGVPGAGNMIVGLASGNTSVLAGLVGSIVDNFQIPTDYYDSKTLKLTDSERIKMIDELHLRMADLYQQVAALGASLSNETKTRYNELSQPRNDMILYGPKK